MTFGLALAILVAAVDNARAWPAFSGDRVGLAAYSLALLALTFAIGGALLELWVRGALRIGARLASPWRARAVAAVLTGLPLAAFLMWIPSDWVASHWKELGSLQRAVVVGVYVGSFIASVVAAGLTFSLHAWYAKRGDRLPWLHFPLLIAVSGFAAACYWADATVYPGLYEEFHFGLAGAFVASAGAALVLSWVTLRRILKRRAANVAWLPWATRGAVALSLVTLVVCELLRPNVFGPSRALIVPKTTHVWKQLTDFDRDGTSGLFGGNDCADFDPRRSPGRFDIPENHVDEDCTGKDVRWPPPPVVVPTTPPETPYNVLLITVDSLRADHLSSYGYPRNTSPNIDRLASTGWRFARAAAQDTKTFESLPSLLTGLYPSNLPRDYSHPRTKNAKSYVYYLTEDAPILTEFLKERGYRTHAVSTLRLLRMLGLDRGFDGFRRQSDVTREAKRFLRKTSEPFFLWVHYQFPHYPYDLHKGHDFGPSDLDRYDSEIARTDREIGEILKLLRRKRRDRRTIVALTADHGESFGEHGVFQHGTKPYLELAHVPLILNIPGKDPAVVETPVELVDFVPTLFEVLGLPVPEAGFDGQSLTAAVAGQRSADYGAYSENYDRKNGLERRSLFTAKWHVIQDLRANYTELYDLEKDPTAQRDVAAQHPEIVAAFHEQLASRALRRVGGVFRRYEATHNPEELARGLAVIQRPALLELALERLQRFIDRTRSCSVAPHLRKLVERPGLIPALREKAHNLLTKCR